MQTIENRLMTASGAKTATLLYDPLGRLYRTTGTFHTNFLYDGDQLIAEHNSTGAVLKRYVHGDEADDPAVQYNGAGLGSASRDWLIGDHQGSIIGVAKGDASAVSIKLWVEARAGIEPACEDLQSSA